MSVTSIDYEEPNVETYKSVRVSYNFNKDEKVFDSGDFVKDWYDATKFTIHLDTQEFHHSNSSSVDHFIMDGAKFDTMYLTVEDGEPCLVTNHDEAMEFFVKEGTTPTWLELRELCGDKKKEK